MPAPTVVGVGDVASGTAAVAPGMPAGVQQRDLLVCLIETAQQAVPLSDSIMLGWSELPSTPITDGTATTGSRLTLRYKYAGPSEPATVSVGDSGDHQIARIIAFRGVPRHLDPWDVLATSVNTSGTTAVSWPSVTTTVADCLILLAIATGRDAATTTNLGNVTNANLTALTERMDNWVAAGGGGGIGAVTGLKATAGAVGASTAALGSTDNKLLATVALREPPPEPSPIRVVGIVTSLDISGQSITIPTGTLAAGETAVAWVCTDAGGAAPGSVTPPDGTWTQRAGQFEDIGDVVHAVYTKPISGAPPATYTFSGHASGSDGWGVLFAVEAGYEFDIAGSQASSGTTLTAPAVTATGAGRALRLYVHHPRAAGPTRRITAVPAAELLRVTDDNYNLLAASSDAVAAAGSTGTQAATADNSHTWRAITLHFKTAAAGGDREGSASVTAASSADTAGQATKAGSATNTASSSAGAAGSAGRAGTATHTAASSATAAGGKAAAVNVGHTATGQVTAAGQNTRAGSATVAALADVAATGQAPRSGAATATASSSATATGSAGRSGQATATAAAEISAAGARTVEDAATLTASVSLDTAGGSQRYADSVVDGTATLTASGARQIGEAVSVDAASSVDVAGDASRGGPVDVTAAGAATADAATAREGAGTVTAATAATAAGEADEAQDGAATLTATGQATATGSTGRSGDSTATAATSADAAGHTTREAAATVAAAATVDAAGTSTETHSGVAVVVAVGDVSATAGPRTAPGGVVVGMADRVAAVAATGRAGSAAVAAVGVVVAVSATGQPTTPPGRVVVVGRDDRDVVVPPAPTAVIDRDRRTVTVPAATEVHA